MVADSRNFQLVCDDATLHACCRQWSKAPLLALDTEFVHMRTFHALLGLIQVHDTHGFWLLDPLKISDFSPFIDLLRDPELIKIMHGCREDMSIFYHYFRTVPESMFDTQLAAAFLSDELSEGYERLTERLCGVHLEKNPKVTVSNWRARPLTDAQLQYAARDVQWLPELFRILRASLKEKDREEWFLEESKLRRERTLQDEHAGTYARQRIGRILGLPHRVREMLETLYAWRERHARLQNKPRQWIMHDKDLSLVARKMPRSLAELHLLPLSRSSQRFLQLELLHMVETKLAQDQAEQPQWHKPSAKQFSEDIGGVLAEVRKKEGELQVAPGILLNRQDIFTLWGHVYSGGSILLPRHLSGWRQKPAVQPALKKLEAAKSRASGHSASHSSAGQVK